MIREILGNLLFVGGLVLVWIGFGDVGIGVDGLIVVALSIAGHWRELQDAKSPARKNTAGVDNAGAG